jgi:hypothetical protein
MPQQIKAHNDIIENDEAIAAIKSNVFAKFFDEYETQREEIDDQCVIADAMDKLFKNSEIAKAEKKKVYEEGDRANIETGHETKADYPSGFARRLNSQLASHAYSVESAQTLPFKYSPVKNPQIWADTGEMQAQADARTTLAKWSLDQEGWTHKKLDLYTEAIKYSQIPVFVRMYPKMKRVRVLGADNKTIVEKEVDVKNYPVAEMVPIWNLWADRNIGTLRDQTVVFTTTKQSIVDLTADRYTSQKKFDEFFAEVDSAFYSHSEFDAEKQLRENRGQTVDDESETDVRRWDIYVKLRLNKSNELSHDPKDKVVLYWFVGYGDNPGDAIYTSCMSNFDPDGEIPGEMMHTTPGSPNELYHPMLSEAIRPHYSMDCLTTSKAIDAYREQVDSPTMVNPSKFVAEEEITDAGEEKFSLDSKKVYFVEDIEGAMGKQINPDYTQLSIFMSEKTRESQSEAAWMSPNMLGEGLGGRAAATEVLAVNQFSMQPQNAWVKYFFSQLYGFIGRKFSRCWENFGDRKSIIAIAGEALEGRVPGLYGEFEIEVDVVDEYIADHVYAAQFTTLLQTLAANPELLRSQKHEINLGEMIVEAFKRQHVKDANRFVLKRGGDGATLQRQENNDMMMTGIYIQTNEDDDHAVHAAECESYLQKVKPLIDAGKSDPESLDEEQRDFVAKAELIQRHLEEHRSRERGLQGSQASPQAPLTPGQEAGNIQSAMLGPAAGGAI